MSFFIRKGGDGAKNYTGGAKKRKASSSGKNIKAKRKAEENEEIDSEGSDIEGKGDAGYESEEDNETAEEKRLRLARIYLEEVENEISERTNNKDEVSKGIEDRLKEDVEKEKGKLRKEFASKLSELTGGDVKYWADKAHKLPLTCTVVSPDSRRVYSASKDAGLVVRDLQTGAREFRVVGGRSGQQSYHPGHCSPVLALAISSDGRYLASGDTDKLIHIWEAATMTRIPTFKGHRAAVSGLAFRRGTHTLYSASHDRSVKIWSVDERAYVETLFGHQDSICALDCGARERCVTVGGRDGTARIWKIVEESQLVFNGPQSSLDCVALLNEEHWATAGEDGHLAVWGIHKKKPLALVHHSHGVDPTNQDPHWVSALAAHRNTDLLLTGSRDGWLRVWQVGEGFRSLTELNKIAMPGFINSLSISECGGWVVAGLGQEHRLGRWWRDKTAKNKLAVMNIPHVEPVTELNDETDGLNS